MAWSRTEPVDVSIAIGLCGKEKNYYELSADKTAITRWVPRAGDVQPTATELKTAWDNWVRDTGGQDMMWLRFKRNKLLRSTDWTQQADVPADTRTKWQTYRQALRDLPSTTEDPDNVTWPTPPS